MEVRLQEHQVDREDPARGTQQPVNSWQRAAPQEYGFYANVNPTVDHPRWSQAREVRLPGFLRNRPTEMFNGYGDQVASLYAGMDLKTELLKRPRSPMTSDQFVGGSSNRRLSCRPDARRLSGVGRPHRQSERKSSRRYHDGTGDWTLRFLCITLAVTPLRRLSGWNGAVKFRRMLGLFAFFYGALHFMTYVILDRLAGLDFSEPILVDGCPRAGHIGGRDLTSDRSSQSGSPHSPS